MDAEAADAVFVGGGADVRHVHIAIFEFGKFRDGAFRGVAVEAADGERDE